MDQKVEKGLNDQLYDFVKLFRVHPSYYWSLPLWLTTYSMQDSLSMARSTGSYVLPSGGDLLHLCAQLYALTFTKKSQVSFVMQAILLSMVAPSLVIYPVLGNDPPCHVLFIFQMKGGGGGSLVIL